MMAAYLWTSPEADCTIIGSQPPAEGIPFTEVDPDTDPGAVYLASDGTVQPVPPCDTAAYAFSAALGRWIDPRSDAEAMASMRHERGCLLRACDWTQMPDAPLSPEHQQAWRAYRKALRDMPADPATDPRNPQWPLPPAE